LCLLLFFFLLAFLSPLNNRDPPVNSVLILFQISDVAFLFWVDMYGGKFMYNCIVGSNRLSIKLFTTTFYLPVHVLLKHSSGTVEGLCQKYGNYCCVDRQAYVSQDELVLDFYGRAWLSLFRLSITPEGTHVFYILWFSALINRTPNVQSCRGLTWEASGVETAKLRDRFLQARQRCCLTNYRIVKVKAFTSETK
jgi:hypothetical protein